MREVGIRRTTGALAMVLAAAWTGAHLGGDPARTSGAPDASSREPPTPVASAGLEGRGLPTGAPGEHGAPPPTSPPAPAAPTESLALPAPPTSGSSIAGRVLLPDGAPCTDALVGVYGGGEGAVTDSNGRFRIEGVPAREVVDLYVTCFGPVRRPPQRLSGVKPGTDTLEIRLERSVTIEGMVVEADGSPATEGFVYVSRADGTSIVEDSGGGIYAIGPDGRFAASGLPPLRHVLSARSMYVSVPAFAVDAPARDVRIVLPPRRLVTGRLIGKRDLGGFQLVAYAPPEPGASGERAAGRATSEVDGSFRIQLKHDGPYEVVVLRTGDERHAHATDVRAGGEPLALRLVEGLAIEGTVVVEGGGPLPSGLWVTVTGPGSLRTVPAVRAGREGRFHVGGLFPGTYRVEAASSERVAASTSVAGIAAGTRDLRLALPLP